MNTSEQHTSNSYCIPCRKVFKDARGLAVHKKRFCGKSSADRQMGPRLRNILGPEMNEAVEKRKTAWKTFVKQLNIETSDLIKNLGVNATLDCPECSELVHKGSFKFHRTSSCVAKDKRLLISSYDIRDFL